MTDPRSRVPFSEEETVRAQPAAGGSSSESGSRVPDGLLTPDESEIREVPDAARDVWERQAWGGYTYEDYLRDKQARRG